MVQLIDNLSKDKEPKFHIPIVSYDSWSIGGTYSLMRMNIQDIYQERELVLVVIKVGLLLLGIKLGLVFVGV